MFSGSPPLPTLRRRQLQEDVSEAYRLLILQAVMVPLDPPFPMGQELWRGRPILVDGLKDFFVFLCAF